jgi:rhodanese-related sulfurtransferase
MLSGWRFLLLLLLFGEASGWARFAYRASPLPGLSRRRTTAPTSSTDPDGEHGDGLDSLFIAVDEIDDDAVEDLFFSYDSSGSPKPWAVPPHLRLCIDKVGRGSAKLLDVRPADAWRRSSISLATHSALEDLLPQLRENGPRATGAEAPLVHGWDRQAAIYVFAAYDDPERVAEAVDALLSAGFEQVLGLRDGFEALRAALPRSSKG